MVCKPGFGYKENVLLRRLPQSIPDLIIYLSKESLKGVHRNQSPMDDYGFAENRHYLEGGDLPDETFGLVVSEYSRFVGIDGTFKGGIQYLYFNQALTPPSIY